ncbi:MAG: cold shock and DUF1294 domain-containing protein [Candidatus Competibacteraceae bacterium]|nr:cold shock and DUF1294 domain-containing protein [Candidatus Competibacteraceae bacterium]
MRIKGKVVSWNEGKGYGFIVPLTGGKQVFLHITALSNRGRIPEIGQVVTYSISADKQGRPCAANATLAGDRIQENKKKNTGTFSILLGIIFIGIVGLSVLSGKLPFILLLFYVGLSLLTFSAYALDKSAAKSGAWRTSESTLHLFSLAGGWPGALIAQQTLRHKSKKESFRFVFWVTVLLNVGGLVWLFTATGAQFLNSLLNSVKWG